jgi:hypothetical protein
MKHTVTSPPGLPTWISVEVDGPGVRLVRHNGTLIGWVCEQPDCRIWNAYRRIGPLTPGELLGAFDGRDAAIKGVVDSSERFGLPETIEYLV